MTTAQLSPTSRQVNVKRGGAHLFGALGLLVCVGLIAADFTCNECETPSDFAFEGLIHGVATTNATAFLWGAVFEIDGPNGVTAEVTVYNPTFHPWIAWLAPFFLDVGTFKSSAKLYDQNGIIIPGASEELTYSLEDINNYMVANNIQMAVPIHDRVSASFDMFNGYNAAFTNYYYHMMQQIEYEAGVGPNPYDGIPIVEVGGLLQMQRYVCWETSSGVACPR